MRIGDEDKSPSCLMNIHCIKKAKAIPNSYRYVNEPFTIGLL
jgi:hypothetical protein